MAKKNTSVLSDISHKSRLGFLLKDSALYGGATAISKVFWLISFSLLVRHFNVAEYGILDYFLTLSTLLVAFVIFGQDSTMVRYFYEYDDVNERRQLISQSLAFQIAGLVFILPLFWYGAEWFPGGVIKAPDRVILFRIVLLQLPFLLLVNFSGSLLKWTFERTRFLIISLGFVVVQSGLLIIAVLFFDAGIADILLVNLITSAIFGVLGLLFIRKWLMWPTDFRHLRDMLPFAIPYGVIGIMGSFSPTLERTLTESQLGVEELGLYAAATKIAMLISLLIQAFQTAWGPFYLSLYKQVGAEQTYNWIFKLFAWGMCISTLAITLLALPLIHILATDRYSAAAIVVFPLVMGLSIQAISWITEIGTDISKRSHLKLYGHIVGLVVALTSIWYLAPIFGLLGVGLGVMTSHIARALVSSWVAQKAYPLPWQYSRVILLILLTLVMGILSVYSRYQWGSYAYNFSLCASLFAVITGGWFIVLNPWERQRVKSHIVPLITRHLPS